MARDYFGHEVPHNEELADVLRAALPERFQPHVDATDYPWNYSYALLEAAVAAATLTQEPYEVDSPSVQRVLDEFIEKLRGTPRSRLLQVVADIDVGQTPRAEGDEGSLGETIEVAGVRVVRVANEPERFIERELPSAGYEIERSHVLVYPGPVSLVVATTEAITDSGTRVEHARRRINNLIAAIRLASASTARAVADIEGDPDRVRWQTPSITPFPSWGIRFVHRPMTLSAGEVGGLAALAAMVDSWTGQGSWAPVRLALGRLGRSLDERTTGIDDQVVDLSIGFEAALGGTETNEIGLRLRTRAGALLTTDGDASDAIYRDVKSLYDLRSRIVHGAPLSEKAAKVTITRVAQAAKRLPAEQYLLALDRWRDLLRRAILTRIALASAPVPWVAGSKNAQRFDVDEFLLIERNRKAWSEHVRRFWSDRGLPLATERAAAPRFMLNRPDIAASDTRA